ncbi:response regulator [Desulfobotulus sp. H1]|uniref:Response regulator n=1 Tax=Desulfobotulus pelophilus TaxID=2823377 RepID=A0ABT3N960_9BACT|nr:response regulator [Desulfobotulus pelophilus]MCW7753983.1 response regulator [Desulfobotulus pelophilus]
MNPEPETSLRQDNLFLEKEREPTLLIIEAEPSFRRNLCGILGGRPFRILESDGCAKTLEVLTSQDVDVIILGLVHMKEEGVRILKVLREKCPFCDVIVINTPQQMPLSIACMKLGAADEFLVPFDLADLEKSILEAVDRKQEAGMRTIERRRFRMNP